MPNGCKCSECELRADCPRLKQLIESGELHVSPALQPSAEVKGSHYRAPTTEDWEDFWHGDTDAPRHSDR